MKRSKFKVGDVVRSRYRKRWSGRIIDLQQAENGWHVSILVTHDQSGRAYRKTFIRDYHEFWLTLKSNDGKHHHLPG